MNNYYKNSWELYKAQTESFTDDYAYYLSFCMGFLTLDLFAGFGRLTNFLFNNGVNIEAVELDSNFAKSIIIPSEKIHICDVLDFSSQHPFERICAGFNSFCLFTKDDDIKKFFHNLSKLLTKNGKASLSYYHHNLWKDSISYMFDYKGNKVYYEPHFDLSRMDSHGIGVWIDNYKGKDLDLEFKYITKIYRDTEQLAHYLYDTDLFIENIVENYGSKKPNGWVEFILAKKPV